MKRIDEAISRRAESSASGKRSLISSPTIAEGEPVSEQKPSSAPDTARLFSKEGPTARSPSFDESIPAWPFSDQKPQRASVEVRAARPPESLKITEPLPELTPAVLAQMGRLPFNPAPPAPASPPAPPAPLAPKVQLESTTLEVPVMRRVRVKTLPLGDTSLQRAIAVLPFAGNTVGTELVDFPRLTIEQYASFHGELSLWPERAAQIYQRYHVMNYAARVALDEHWKSHFEERPEARARFEEAFAQYISWVRGAGRK